MNLDQQIATLQNSIQAKNAEIVKLTGDCVEKGVTPDDETEQKITALENDIATVQKSLDRLLAIQALQAKSQTATPVHGQTVNDGVQTAQGSIIVKSNLPAGVGFAQFARAKMLSQLDAKKGLYRSPVEVAKSLNYDDEVIQFIEKAAQVASTGNASVGSTLIVQQRLASEFIEMVRNATIFDKLKGYRTVPFKVKIPSQLTGGTAKWVGEAEKKPLTNPTFGEVEIKEHKLAAITVYTDELIRSSDPAVDVLIRDDLIHACKKLIDETFLGSQEQSNTTPIGMLHGVEAIQNTGTTASAYEADLLKLIEAFLKANLSLDNAYFVMSETRAAQMALLRDALGNTYFNGMSLRGERTLLGVPVVTSETAGNKIALLKMSEILVAEDGAIDVAYSDQATLVDGDVTHNLWQENKFAVRVEKYMTWAKRRPIASAWINYAG